jgi:hypothetical protein
MDIKTIISCLIRIWIEIFKIMPSKMRAESQRSVKHHEWLIVVWKCLSHIADSSGAVQLAEAVINAPLSVIAMWKRGGRKSYCDFAATFPMAKSSCCYCVFSIGDLHCSCGPKIKSALQWTTSQDWWLPIWASDLSADQSGAWTDPDQCSR